MQFLLNKSLIFLTALFSIGIPYGSYRKARSDESKQLPKETQMFCSTGIIDECTDACKMNLGILS